MSRYAVGTDDNFDMAPIVNVLDDAINKLNKLHDEMVASIDKYSEHLYCRNCTEDFYAEEYPKECPLCGSDDIVEY